MEKHLFVYWFLPLGKFGLFVKISLMGITNKHKVPSKLREIESLVASARHVNINITVTKNFHKSEKVIHLSLSMRANTESS